MVKFRELTADEITRDLYERREKARRDQAMHIKQRERDIAKNLLRMDMSLDQISKATGLTLEEVESLC